MMAAFLILVLAAGVFSATYDYMRDLYEAMGLMVKRWIKSLRETELNDRGETFERVRSLMWITMGMGSDLAVWLFFILSVLSGLGVLLTIGLKLTMWLRIVAVVTSSFIPYLILKVRMEKVRVKSSLEGEILLSELTDNYKIYYYNMREAVEKTARSIEDAPNSKRLLADLSRGLERASTENSVKRLLTEFSLSINTSWSNTLNNLMYFSILKGIRVEEALEDLETTIMKARKVREYSRRQMNEPRLMIRYLVPGCYLLTFVSGIRFFGLGADEFIRYQFYTETGATWFTILLILYIISYMANLYFSQNKLDL